MNRNIQEVAGRPPPDPAVALPDPAKTLQIEPEMVAAWFRLPRDQRPRLIDCREDYEIAICHIDGHEWIPLAKFPSAVEQMAADQARGIVIYCHHGMRSLRAAEFLRTHGIENAFSLVGGIEAWAERIVPTMSRY